MNYALHAEPQGTEAWLAGRNTRLNASELVLAAGDGMNGRTRTDLIRKLATGIEPDVDAFTQKLYDEGHRFEALARPLAEEIIGETLYPITASIKVDGLTRLLGASLDGATASDEINHEHKRMNAALRAALAQGIIPVEYHWQMEQGQMINGATRTLFMASEWDDDDNLIEEMHVWYESNPVLRDRIIPIWKQAEEDAENYQHVEAAPVAVAAPIKDLPTLFIQATGEVTATNMPDFKVQIAEFLGSINMTPATDQEFADGKEVAKKLRELAKKIIERKEDMLAQTATIGEIAKEIDFLSKTINANALELEKAVEREEKARKLAIVVAGRMALDEHIGALNKRLGKPYMPTVTADFDAAIKGKRLLTAMDDAVATLLANKKIETSAIADRIEINLNYLRDTASEHKFLFADTGIIVLKASDDFEALVKLRISEHKSAEAKKLEAIKEAARVEAEANAAAKAKAEQEEIARQQEISRYQSDEIARHQKMLVDEPAAQPTVKPVITIDGPFTSDIQIPKPDDGARIRLGEISERLGFTVTADFIASLGFQPVETIKAAKLYRESHFKPIVAALIDRLEAVRQRDWRAAA